MHRHHDAKIEDLHRAPLFRGCTKAQLRRIASIADRIDVGDGHQLCAEGTAGRELFVIRSGTVDVSAGQVPVATLGPGDVLGELALLARRPRTATAVARGDVSVYVVGRVDLEVLLEQTPGLAESLLRTVCDRLLDRPVAVG